MVDIFKIAILIKIITSLVMTDYNYSKIEAKTYSV